MIVGDADLTKGDPVLIILTDILKQEPVLCFRDAIVVILVCRFYVCSQKRPNDNWFQFKQERQPDNSSNSLNNLSKCQEPTAVGID